MAFEFDGTPIGPYFTANRLLIVKTDEDGNTYQLNIFPDLFNEQLQAAGKPLQFYYLPDSPRMARYDNGDYMFHFDKFEGVLTADDNIAVASPGQTEVAGGVLAFTSTLKIPDAVITAAVEQLKNEIQHNPKYSTDKNFKLTNSGLQVNLGVVPIVDNDVYISSLTPENVKDPASSQPNDPWAWKMQGEGKGTINPVGNNAYTAMVGQYPAQIIDQAFHGASSPIFVHNTLKHKFYTGPFKAEIHGQWDSIFTHFSTALSAKVYFVKADLQAAFNDAVKTGVITRRITVDTEIITPEKEKEYEAQVDKVFDKFLDIAAKTILEVQPPKIENAKAGDPVTSLLNPVSINFSMKYERDESHLTLDFNEEIDETLIKDNTISAHMMGFYEQLAHNAETEKKYFDTVHLDEGFRKIHVLASARAFWPDDKGQGDPIDQLVLEVGYPDSTGSITYKNSGLFMENKAAPKSTTTAPAIWSKENKDRIIIFDFARQDSLPKDQQNTIHVRRTIRYRIDPRVEIPGYTTNFPEEQVTDHTIEVKADALGRLIVGPIQLDTKLSEEVKAIITFRQGSRTESVELNADNVKEIKYFEAWTNDPATALTCTYQVEMIHQAKTAGIPAIRYTGQESPIFGNTPLIAHTPSPPADLAQQIAQMKQQEAAFADF